MSVPTIFSTEGFSAYYKAVSNEPKDLKKSIKTSLNFHYGDATYEKFEAHHVPQDLGSRLVEAIPAFAYSALVKTTYHIALALLNTVKGNFTLARSNIYAFVRDLDEAGGWLLKIFHDKLGSYVVQRSLFQKSCYSLFEARQNQTSRNSNGKYLLMNGILIPDWANVLTLKEFKNMDEEDRAKVITDLGSFKSLLSASLSVQTLKKNLEALKSDEKDFFQRLEGASDRFLELVTFADLIQHLEVVKYALLSDDEFTSIKLEDIRGASYQTIKFIRKRVEHFRSEELSLDPLKEDTGEITIVELCNASGSVIGGHLKTIPSEALQLLTKEQLPQLDLSGLTTEKEFYALFGYIGDEESKKRFACLSGPQVQSILPNLGSYLKLISKEQLPQLDLSDLRTEKEFYALFGYRGDEESKKRFACLSGPQVQSLLPSLGDYLELVSKQQLPQLDLSGLTTEEDFYALFGYRGDEESKKRFACLSKAQVKSIRPFLGSYLGLASKKQL